MARIFVSYSKTDEKYAEGVISLIENKYHAICFSSFSNKVRGSENKNVTSLIKDSDCLVLIYSNNAIESKQVKIELEAAYTNGIIVIPCNVGYYLAEGQSEYYFSNRKWSDDKNDTTEDTQINLLKKALDKVIDCNYEKVRRELCVLMSQISQFGVNDYLQDFINKFYTLSNETYEGKNDTYLQDLWKEFIKEFKIVQKSSKPDFTKVISIMNTLWSYIR